MGYLVGAFPLASIRFDDGNARHVILYEGGEFGELLAHRMPHGAHFGYIAIYEKCRGRNGQYGDEGEFWIEVKEHGDHRYGDNRGERGFGNAVCNKVFDGFDVVDGASHEIASALAIEKAMGQVLQVLVHARHKCVHHAIGSDVGKKAITITGDTAKQINPEE